MARSPVNRNFSSEVSRLKKYSRQLNHRDSAVQGSVLRARFFVGGSSALEPIDSKSCLVVLGNQRPQDSTHS